MKKSKLDEIFSCKCCGHCCHGTSTVSLSEEEQRRIASFLGLSLDDFLNKYCIIKDKRIEMKIVNRHCIFYNEENGFCNIHPVKPDACRQWPLHPSILYDRGAWEAIRKDCPGFSKNVTYKDVCRLIRSVISSMNTGSKYVQH